MVMFVRKVTLLSGPPLVHAGVGALAFAASAAVAAVCWPVGVARGRDKVRGGSWRLGWIVGVSWDGTVQGRG